LKASMTEEMPFNHDIGGDVDQIMARELNNLSFYDRSRIQEEIHGAVSLAMEETPSQIASSLQSLQNEIDQTSATERKAYDLAMASESSFVQGNEFRIKFLRAEFFDAKRACWRMMVHLRLLGKYFGPSALLRPLRFSDFSRKEQSIVRAGFIQILPSRDRAGRLVAFDNDSVYASDETADCIPRMVSDTRHASLCGNTRSTSHSHKVVLRRHSDSHDPLLLLYCSRR
jgi:hypothetical protein